MGKSTCRACWRYVPSSTGHRYHRIRNGLKHVAADRLVVAPDCGMKYMPRHTAFGKLKAMCDAAAAVRREIG